MPRLTQDELKRRAEERRNRQQEEDAGVAGEAKKLHLGGASRFDVDIRQWPTDPDLTFGIQPLVDDDVLEAEVEAAAAVAKLPGEIGQRGTLRDKEYGFAIQAAILCRAIVDPESRKRIYGSMAELRRDTVREELDAVALWYNSHQQHVCPLQRQTSEALFRSTWELVKKTRDSTCLALFERSTLLDFALSLVSRLERWDGETSSTSTSDGAPPSATSKPSTESEQPPPSAPPAAP
jgi:hypothetical protein